MKKAQVLIPVVTLISILIILFALTIHPLLVNYKYVEFDPTNKLIETFYFFEQILANGTNTGFKILLSQYENSNFNPLISNTLAKLSKDTAINYYYLSLKKIMDILPSYDFSWLKNSSYNPIIISILASSNKGNGSYFNASVTIRNEFELLFFTNVTSAKVITSKSSIYNYYYVIVNYTYITYFNGKKVNVLNEISPSINGSNTGNFVYLESKNSFIFILPSSSIGKTIISLTDSYGIVEWVLV